MSTKSLTSLGSFRNLNESPEARYKRLELKYGKELHEAIARKDVLKKERKVKNWMEVFVLLSEQKNPIPIGPVPTYKTPNGQHDALLAAGIVKDPTEEAMLRKAARPSPGAKRDAPAQQTFTISKEDRELCQQWLENAVETEQGHLDAVLQSGNATLIREQEEKLSNLRKQLTELQNFEQETGGQTLTIDFSADSFLSKRVKHETMMASLVGLLAFVVMIIIMYFLR